MFIQSRMVSAESNNIRTANNLPGNHTLTWIGHSLLFKVILIVIGQLNVLIQL